MAELPAPMRIVKAPEDLELAARCVAGDRQAQRALFARERQRIHSTLFRIVGSNAHIDDLVQDAFLEVFRSLRGFRGESSLATWIDRCTVRVAYAYFRSKALVPRLETVSDVAAGDASAEQRVMHREAARRLYGLLDRLEPTQRIAFSLHKLDGKPLTEVAEMMESSLVATKVRVWRARQFIEHRAKSDPLLKDYVDSR